jgi:prepilin-type N-terminal cleavage/methylation domain-containing protein
MNVRRSISRHARRAVTLVELLVVLALVAVVGTLGAYGSRDWLQARQVRAAAEEVEQVLRTARDLAVRRGEPVRVAFSLPAEAGQGSDGTRERPPAPAVATLVFEIPTDPDQRPRVEAPTADWEGGGPTTSRRTEWLAGVGGALPEALVGRWLFAPGATAWKRLDDRVVLESELFQRFASQGDTFAEENLARPPAVWGAPTDDGSVPPRRWSAVHPVDHDLIPHPPPLDPWFGPLAADEKMPSDHPRAKRAPASAVFGSAPIRHFPKKFREETRMLRLPAIEFAPDGGLSCSWTGRLRLKFRPLAAPSPEYTLSIDATTGEVGLADDGGAGHSPATL